MPGCGERRDARVCSSTCKKKKQKKKKKKHHVLSCAASWGGGRAEEFPPNPRAAFAGVRKGAAPRFGGEKRVFPGPEPRPSGGLLRASPPLHFVPFRLAATAGK